MKPILAALVLVHSLLAQVDTGTIAGTLTDSTGAVLPAAIVTIRHTETKQEFKLSSNDLGQFVSPPLPPIAAPPKPGERPSGLRWPSLPF